MRKLIAFTGLAIVALITHGSAWPQQKPGVDLKTVNYEGLKKAVRDQRGKVVLVDFWGEF
jgi:hypothetical protein